MKIKIFLTIFSTLLLASFAAAQSGGGITIEKSVIASGGGTSSSGSITIESTSGQPIAGETQGGSFTISGGFITPPLAPTAASVRVSGKVLTPDGRGLVNAVVTMTDASGNIRSTRTSTFGFYRFEDVAVGETYIFQTVSKRFQFVPQVVTVTEEVSGLNFTAFQ